MPRSTAIFSRFLLIGIMVAPGLSAAEAAPSLDRQFTQTIRPLLATYCIGCHSGASPAAQLDLKSYTTLDSVIRDYPHWNSVLEKVSAKEMPPKPVQMPDAAREQLTSWVEAMRTGEAKKSAGDPGVVLARRLSNSEYNYTIRDLTGVDLKPTKEFPVDPANTSGFDNSGESLTMSPALLNKYLQAARDVANHVVLTPSGFLFSPYPTLVETDREKFAIKRIVDFYASQPTDYADYFQAAWKFKNRAALGKRSATLANIAAESKLSPKYLPMVWGILEGPADVGPIAKLQAMWRALPAAAGARPEQLRKKCVEMREFVSKIRTHTAMQFAAPVVRGLPQGSQPLLNWKLREFSLHRRESDPKALLNDTDPEPAEVTIPRYAGLHQEAAPRWAALMAKARAGDLDLIVPAAERGKYEAAFSKFASVFPDTFYVKERGRFWPDESQDRGRLLSAGFHSVVGYYRDDNPLSELILDENGKKELDRLWLEFDYMADATNRTWDQYFFNQCGEVLGKGAEAACDRPADKAVNSTEVIYEKRDAYLAKAAADPKNDPIALEAIRHHFQRMNDTFRSLEKLRLSAEPNHLESLLQFAAKAYRRPLTPAERTGMLAYYKDLRAKGNLTHEDAIRDSIVTVLMSPKFCYRIDLSKLAPASEQPPVLAKFSMGFAAAAKATKPAAGVSTVTGRPLSAYALASRLSYFLWSSMPDEELLKHAESGDLRNTDVLVAQTRRMLKDERARGLAVEFAGNWLDFRRFETHNAVDRERFPAFNNELREAMFEEPIRFIEDVIRNDRSVLDMLYGKYTFVNPVLAKHYGMPEVAGGNEKWVRVDDADKYGRGGILPMSVFLTQNAPGLRTSPVKRGYWVVRRVLGENIPAPPPNVPELPKDEGKSDLTVRELLAKHRENALCAGCHARFDSFGLSFEGYGPVGEKREKDLAGRAVDINAVFPSGDKGVGVAGVQSYIQQHRQKDYINNISRKLLAYSLGRSLMLSDEPMVEGMSAAMASNGYRFSPLVETIVTSPQFLNKRSAASVAQKGK